MTDQTVTFGNTLVVKGSSANALSVGVNGTTNPVMNIVTNVASPGTGLQVTGNASGSGVTVAAISSGGNDSLLLQGVGTGIVQTTATTASASVGAFKTINSNASAVGMATMLSNLSANNAANAAELGFSMNNATPAEKQFGAIRVTSSTVTAGAEGGTMILRTMQSGAMTTVVTLSSAGLTTLANGLTVTAGGAVVTAGGLQVTAGNVGVGTAPISNVGLFLSETVTASGGNAFGLASGPTLTAAANSDVLTGLQTKPVIATATKTGLTVYGHQIDLSQGQATGVTTAIGQRIETVTVGVTNDYGEFILAPSGGGTNNAHMVLGSAANGGTQIIDTSVAGCKLTTAGAWTSASHEWLPDGQRWKVPTGAASDLPLLDMLQRLHVHIYDVTGEPYRLAGGEPCGADCDGPDVCQDAQHFGQVAEADQRGHIGLFAEQLHAVSPLLSRDGLGVDAVSLAAFSLAALQALAARITALEAKRA